MNRKKHMRTCPSQRASQWFVWMSTEVSGSRDMPPSDRENTSKKENCTAGVYGATVWKWSGMVRKREVVLRMIYILRGLSSVPQPKYTYQYHYVPASKKRFLFQAYIFDASAPHRMASSSLIFALFSSICMCPHRCRVRFK